MKQKWIGILSGLLLVQLVLAVAINRSSDEYGAFQPKQKLLAFDKAAVDGLRIEDGSTQVALERVKGHWQLPKEQGFPADQAGVEALLKKLAALDKGWPVATSASATRRFKVAKDRFERRLTLLSGDQTLAQLYVGSSPGYRKVYVRPAGEQAVYSVPFNSWEASAKETDWIDKGLLSLDAKGIVAIELPGIELQRQDKQWRLADQGKDEKLAKDAVERLVRQLSGLRIEAPAVKQKLPEKPLLEVKVTRKQGDPLNYRFYQDQQGKDYIVQRSDIEWPCKLAQYNVKPLLEAHRDKLLQQTPQPQPAQAKRPTTEKQTPAKQSNSS